MCGICGIIETASNKPVDPDVLLEMREAMVHRGPNDAGSWIDGSVGLAMRRLSIIDLEGSKQPLFNEDGSIVLVFNGEIYNFLELRKRLEAFGHKFQTSGDGETIIHAYEEFGNQCVQEFNGMFAFALWDKRCSRLFVARDRLGKKPFYYYFNGRRFLFGSEMKAILKDKSIPRRLDYKALDLYLTYGYIPPPRTIFEGIQKLPAAHWLLLEGSKMQIQRYWIPAFAQDKLNLPDEEAAKLLRVLLEDAVRLRLISDVPLGAFLSGGIDSSVVAALMSRISNSKVKTFSIGFAESDYSEIEFARTVAKHLGTEHYEFTVTPNVEDILPKLVLQYDEPFSDYSTIPTYYVSKITREHVTVALSGDGGDETFAGYMRYQLAKTYDLWASRLPFGASWLAGKISDALPYNFRGKGILKMISLSKIERYISQMMIFGSALKERFYTHELISLIDQPDDGNYLHECHRLFEFDGEESIDYITICQAIDSVSYLPEDILVKVDRASMFCSLETRAPLLDYRLVDYMASLPVGLKLRGGSSKYLLKQAVKDLLPQSILQREKHGFGMPLSRWFRNELKGFISDILLSSSFTKRGFFRTEAIQWLLENQFEGRANHSLQLWALLWLEIWFREFLDA